MRKKGAVVLLSGGMDSAVAAAIAKKNFEIYAITFDYGQRHKREIASARKLAKKLGAKEHKILKIPNIFAGSALTDDIPVPRGRKNKGKIPATYVPARNLIFLALAAAFGETRKCFDIFIGVNIVDYSGYPDCGGEFLRAFERAANLATKAGVEGKKKFRVRAPLLKKSKAQIIKLGEKLGVDFSLTHTCYAPAKRGLACGACDACRLRLKGFKSAGTKDPAQYTS